ncbi:MAG: transposase [Gammaproteobacteria bacterium]|nr:transposase [Gammaproteobacteria bacterium]MCI0591677.1 transposase [Gammaproteobacteria bacterium]
MARAGPRKTNRYGEEFKAAAVKLSSLPGVLIQDVAAALDIHPFDAAEYWKAARNKPEGARKERARAASAQGGAVGAPRAA